MAHFTLDDFQHIINEERRLLQALMPQKGAIEFTFSPAESAVNAVLQFAQSSSQREPLNGQSCTLYWN